MADDGICISVQETPVECGRLGGLADTPAQREWRQKWWSVRAYREMDEKDAQILAARLRQGNERAWKEHYARMAEQARINGAKGGRPIGRTVEPGDESRRRDWREWKRAQRERDRENPR